MATEKRLIDANVLIDLIKDTYCSNCNNYHEIRCRACDWDDALSYIEDAPTVDAVEVVQGMWLWYTEDIYTCSNCYEKVHVKEVMGEPDYHYCPNCGAVMEDKYNDG